MKRENWKIHDDPEKEDEDDKYVAWMEGLPRYYVERNTIFVHAVIDFIREFTVYEEVTVGEQDYLLVHAGLGDFDPEKDIEEYSLHDLIWVGATDAIPKRGQKG